MTRASTIAEEQQAIIEEFELFDDWREKIEYVLELGRSIDSLPAEDRVDAHKIKGCQSQVWMVANHDRSTDRLHLKGDSDAFIVRGLIALLLRLYADRAPADILAEPPTVFDRIGLGTHLSPGRANGLHAMIRRIQQIASAAVSEKPAPAA